MGIDELGVDQMGVDEMGSRRSWMTPSRAIRMPLCLVSFACKDEVA